MGTVFPHWLSRLTVSIPPNEYKRMHEAVQLLLSDC